MTNEQVTAMIDSMTDGEIRLVEAALRRRGAVHDTRLREEPSDTSSDAVLPGRKMSSGEAMDYVFENFDGLLSRLAK